MLSLFYLCSAEEGEGVPLALGSWPVGDEAGRDVQQSPTSDVTAVDVIMTDDDDSIDVKPEAVKPEDTSDTSSSDSDSEEEEVPSQPSKVKGKVTKQTPVAKKNTKLKKSSKMGEDAFMSDKENGQSLTKPVNGKSPKVVKKTPKKTPEKV